MKRLDRSKQSRFTLNETPKAAGGSPRKNKAAFGVFSPKRGVAQGVAEAERPRWLPLEGPGNSAVPPERWAMSATQFHGFLGACKATQVYQALVQEEKVDMYKICDLFVKPWTLGTGNSVALLLNPQPLAAEVMISHAWAEEIDECSEALMLHFARYTITEATACWFCVFSMYQPGDVITIQEQLELDPFGRVLSTMNQLSQQAFDEARGMVVIHTSASEVYERLWCVFEIGKATLDGVPTKAACSFAYIVAQSSRSKESLQVFTENARCSVPEDEERIRELMMSDFGGAEMLNRMIWDFRLAMMRQMGYELRDGGWHAIPNTSFYRKGKNASAELLELQAECLRKLALSFDS
ncbi:Hypothetical protein (Fragment) [Durusdinium trenchii]|uniref:Uncharacterized protein n=1 Tax=Durusdinium trenchii TaxID=1381693 RepID=A0ABP0M4M7_9DINO